MDSRIILSKVWYVYGVQKAPTDGARVGFYETKIQVKTTMKLTRVYIYIFS